MKFDFGLEDLWQKKNKEIQDKIQLNPISSARVYPGISYAVSEIVRGLIRLFPHRKTFAIVRGSGPFYDDISDFAGMEGLVRTELTVQDLKDPTATIGKIPKDCLFVLGSLDDPFTGELFPFETLYEAMHKNRCFTIALSHSVHLARGFATINQYMAVIAKVPNQGAVALLGQRASKVPPLAVGLYDWFVPEHWTKAFDKNPESKAEIQDFESRLPKEFSPFFSADVPRCFDRAVIRATNFDGDACIRLLAEDLKLKLKEPGADALLETLSLCRWSGVNTFNWYEHQGRSIKDLRGVFMIDQKLAIPATLQALQKVAQKITELQS